MNTVAVIDIGKTNAKVALVDVSARRELAVRRTANRVIADGPYPHFDAEGLWQFILESLRELARSATIEAIVTTTHGASAALLDAEGELALPILDYEFDGPDRVRADYDALRPPFSESGSPGLPIGLNLGAQLFWQEQAFPDAFARTAAIVPYPQYWAYRLSGVRASEATSWGTHTDLWNPYRGDYSRLVIARGWRPLFPPLRAAGDVLGPILPAIVAATRLPPETQVYCGIHDSNASLFPHLLSNDPPFAVVSTGTWVVCMNVGAGTPDLDPARDTLINVNASGQPVPSARFMGGREYAMLCGDAGPDAGPTETEIETVLKDEVTIPPPVQPGSGPFAERAPRWESALPPTSGERQAAASFYLAMMTATCLDLIKAAGPVIVEGPFAGNAEFLKMLHAATGRPVLRGGSGETGTTIGAALLTGEPDCRSATMPVHDGTPPAALVAYADAWRMALRAR